MLARFTTHKTTVRKKMGKHMGKMMWMDKELHCYIMKCVLNANKGSSNAVTTLWIQCYKFWLHIASIREILEGSIKTQIWLQERLTSKPSITLISVTWTSRVTSLVITILVMLRLKPSLNGRP
jgi:hypothetical protein